MSATEVIELIKKLSPEEQALVREFVRGDPDTPKAKVIRYISDEEFEQVTDQVFKDNHELLGRLAQ